MIFFIFLLSNHIITLRRLTMPSFRIPLANQRKTIKFTFGEFVFVSFFFFSYLFCFSILFTLNFYGFAIWRIQCTGFFFCFGQWICKRENLLFETRKRGSFSLFSFTHQILTREKRQQQQHQYFRLKLCGGWCVFFLSLVWMTKEYCLLWFWKMEKEKKKHTVPCYFSLGFIDLQSHNFVCCFQNKRPHSESQRPRNLLVSIHTECVQLMHNCILQERQHDVVCIRRWRRQRHGLPRLNVQQFFF